MNMLCKRFYFILFLVIAILPFSSTAFSSKQATKTSSYSAIAFLEGTLEIRLANYLDEKTQKNKKDIIEYALQADESTVYSLIFTDTVPKNLKSGQRIRISKGLLKQSTNHTTNELLISAKDVTIIRDLAFREIPEAFGKQKTLVMLVNFQNQPLDKPWTLDEVKNTVFTTINDMYYEFSYQQTTVVGEVVGWYTLPLDSQTSCDEIKNSLPDLALQAARNAGVNVSLYTRMIYMFPRASNCSWAGLGTLGGNPTSNAWINGVNNAAITAHELGHNLGLYHSHSLECQGSANEGTCSEVEYGDYADTMGNTTAYAGPHFNAYQKEHLGWLGAATSPPIQTITTSGTYTIDTYESINQNVKALKIEKAPDPYSKNYYYIEFRQGIGFDKNLSTCTDCNFTKGIIVHQGNEIDFNSSQLLDMSPTDTNKRKLIALLPGMSFTDLNAPNGGVTLFVESISTTAAKVRITFGNTPPLPCVQASPTIAIGPGYAEVIPGENQEYTVWVKNRNSATCPPASFSFSVTPVHEQIPVSFTPQVATIASGKLQEISISANTTTSAPKGSYLIRVDAFNIAAPQYKGFTNGSLVVK